MRVTAYVSMEKLGRLSLNYPGYPLKCRTVDQFLYLNGSFTVVQSFYASENKGNDGTSDTVVKHTKML